MYVVERWLARLSKSPYAEDFVLKGGMLMATFGVRRPTVDADTLARNLPSDPEAVARRVVEIADMADPEDGLVFMTETVKTSIIRDQARYSGVRVIMDARLATARVSLHLDVNFGDPVTPEPALVELPSLRGGSGPVRVLGYPIESVLAEKIVTAIDLGLANTRVRDFADICLLIGQRGVLCGTLREAIDATARFREVPLIPRCLRRPPGSATCAPRRTLPTVEDWARRAACCPNSSLMRSRRPSNSPTPCWRGSMKATPGTLSHIVGVQKLLKHRIDEALQH